MYYLCGNKTKKQKIMTTQQLRVKIESKGYKVTSLMQGGYIAKKGQQSLKSETITSLYNLIFN
jgi:hypothetical protein